MPGNAPVPATAETPAGAAETVLTATPDFNVSAAETDHHDLWQRAELTVCVVSTDRTQAERVLREADQMVAAAAGARVLDTATSYL